MVAFDNGSAPKIGVEDDSRGVDDRLESRLRPRGEVGFGLGEDQVGGGQGSFGVSLEACAGFVEGRSKRVESQRTTKRLDEMSRILK